MKRALLLVLAAVSCAFAQENGNVIYQTTSPVGAVASGGSDKASGPVLGAPYSATITNESHSDPRGRQSPRADEHGNHRARFARPHASGYGSAANRELVGGQCAASDFHPRPGRADFLHSEPDGKDGAEDARASSLSGRC